MGIDYGSKRVGVAFTDESGSMAFPHKVLNNDKDLLKSIFKLINEKEVGEIVIGHSLDKDGNPNKINRAIEEFITDVTLELGLPIHLESEIYTTQAALRIQGRNDMTDAAAAALILDNYLTRNNKK